MGLFEKIIDLLSSEKAILLPPEKNSSKNIAISSELLNAPHEGSSSPFRTQTSQGQLFDDYIAMKKHVENCSKSMQQYRTKPFTDFELCFGYISHMNWLIAGNRNPYKPFFMAESDSAREISIEVMVQIYENPKVTSYIQANVKSFQSEEVVWAIYKETHEEWNECFSRAIILISRSLAYVYTGKFQTDRRPAMSDSTAYEIGMRWASQYMDMESVKYILPLYKFLDISMSTLEDIAKSKK